MMILPDYTLQESARVKDIHLKISAQEGLIVIVPKGFNHQHLAEILRQRRGWIEKHLAALSDIEFPPRQLEFLAVNKTWQIQYLKQTQAEKSGIEWQEKRDERCLILTGEIQNTDFLKYTLHHWLLKQGRQHFEPWLTQLSKETGLKYNKLQIRKQKTRWGSCSTRLTISLNYKLLFLPRQFARYVLLHELAHTRYLNHSKQFWDLLVQLDADALALDKALDTVGQECVPAWL